MIVAQRRDTILEVVESKGFASLAELSSQLGVSESTVRRDLEHLEGTGQLRRTRGGVAYVGDSLASFEFRATHRTAEKMAIARTVATMIGDGESVLLDGGTTTLEVARQLMEKELQVVTNSLPIANLLVNAPRIELIFVGGYVYPKTGVALGPLVVAALSRLHVRKLIFSVGGVTEAGLFNSNSLLVEAEQQMLESAEERILAIDQSKLGHVELARLCGLDQVHRVVTNGPMTEHWQKVFERAHVECHVAAN